MVSTAIHTTPTPELSPLARAFSQLERLDVVIRGDYQRTTRRGALTRSATVRVPLPVKYGREAAAKFWREHNRSDLADSVTGSREGWRNRRRVAPLAKESQGRARVAVRKETR